MEWRQKNKKGKENGKNSKKRTGDFVRNCIGVLGSTGVDNWKGSSLEGIRVWLIKNIPGLSYLSSVAGLLLRFQKKLIPPLIKQPTSMTGLWIIASSGKGISQAFFCSDEPKGFLQPLPLLPFLPPQNRGPVFLHDVRDRIRCNQFYWWIWRCYVCSDEPVDQIWPDFNGPGVWAHTIRLTNQREKIRPAAQDPRKRCTKKQIRCLCSRASLIVQSWKSINRFPVRSYPQQKWRRKEERQGINF